MSHNGTGNLYIADGDMWKPIGNITDFKLNLKKEKPMDKIFQMVVVPHYEYKRMQFVDSLDETSRGEDGFGSTDNTDNDCEWW